MTGHIGMGLTPGQAKVLAVIKRWLATEGIAPSLREIAVCTGVRSISKVHEKLCALEERGYIRRRFHKHRTIELLGPARQWEEPLRAAVGPFHFIPVSALTWPVAA